MSNATDKRDRNARPTFPRRALIVGFSMVAMSVTAAMYKGQVNPSEPVALPDSHITAARALRFEDDSNGQVVVIDATTNTTIERLDVGTNGFLRATLRGLARARKAVSKGAETPFVIQRHANGQVLLVDPVTERFIDLRAFGPSNSVVFTRYLDTGDTGHSGG